MKKQYAQALARLRDLFTDNGVCAIPIRLPQGGCLDGFDAYSVRLNRDVAASIDSFRPWLAPNGDALRLAFYTDSAASPQRRARIESCVRNHYSIAASVADKQRRLLACATAMLALLTAAAGFFVLRLAPQPASMLMGAFCTAGLVLTLAAAQRLCLACASFNWYARVFNSNIEFH